MCTVKQTDSALRTGSHKGLIYRRWVPLNQDENIAVEQLILPTQCRVTILRLAHSIPMAGHLGKTKTASLILWRFYWPTLSKDVGTTVTCAECQRASPGKKHRTPFIPMPIGDEPFHHNAMDIVGPLPRSRRGHRYILAVCNYATRYPEALPLCSIHAEHVDEELVTLFLQVGILSEIFTDQESNFMPQLLTEVYRLLGIKSIRTTPYHLQTDGLVERFN